jgi:endonuclease/exonuclease/phosphatase family metal-dependent hydrolase
MPTRISLISYNIWNTERWHFREAALRKFLELFSPDVLAVQELRRRSRTFIDGVLPSHARVHDSFAGWALESNIYWRDTMFSEIEHGAEDVGIREHGHRRLFWVRLKLRDSERSMLVATAHLTHQRHAAEVATGQSPRVSEAKRIIVELKRLREKREPVFFMGDLNDPVHPTNLLHQDGFVSCFSALGLVPPPTFKCYPTADVAPGKLVMNQCIDWIVANDHARPIAACVPQFYFKDSAPSDHWPVQAVYEVT